jgi:hypothetical protein
MEPNGKLKFCFLSFLAHLAKGNLSFYILFLVTVAMLVGAQHHRTQI